MNGRGSPKSEQEDRSLTKESIRPESGVLTDEDLGASALDGCCCG